MTPASFPSAAELLPHGSELVLIERIVELARDRATCRIVPGQPEVGGFEGPEVPSAIALEYLAQTCGVLAGSGERASRAGVVASVRGLVIRVASFPTGRPLVAVAELEAQDARMATYQAVLSDEESGSELASGRIAIAFIEGM